jgi:hypothetical protein
MTIDVKAAVTTLEALTLTALRGADDATLRKFHQAAIHWCQLAATETRDRAKLRRATKPPSGEAP